MHQGFLPTFVLFCTNPQTAMKQELFTPKTKMADILLANYRLLYVLPCFGMELGFGESTAEQACRSGGVSLPLFVLVCNLYTFDHYLPNVQTLEQIPLANLMQYLQNSHRVYLSARMPQIIESILNLIDVCRISHGETLISFCEKYREQVIAHFAREEQTVFPYIAALLAGTPADTYKIREYGHTHTNLNAALNDLKNIIIKYLPRECTIDKCRSVLVDLFFFEADLKAHSVLEDKILVPLVERIENTLQ